MDQERPQDISQEASQCFPRYEVGDILDEFLMSTMWYIWRFIIPSRIWSHWTYYICSYCRVGRQNIEVNILKLHGHGKLSFSHIWHYIYLLMFFQQVTLCEAWRENIPKKDQRHSKRSRDFWIWDCWILCQQGKWTYDSVPGSGILCSWVTKVIAHHFPTRHFYMRRIQGYLHSS